MIETSAITTIFKAALNGSGLPYKMSNDVPAKCDLRPAWNKRDSNVQVQDTWCQECSQNAIWVLTLTTLTTKQVFTCGTVQASELASLPCLSQGQGWNGLLVLKGNHNNRQCLQLFLPLTCNQGCLAAIRATSARPWWWAPARVDIWLWSKTDLTDRAGVHMFFWFVSGLWR